MSKEFEEIVLKKLEKLDERTKNTDGIIENVILKKLEKLDDLETELKDTKQGVQNLAKDINQRLGKLEIETKDTGEVVMDIRQRFTKFDYEINRKIDTLFDANKANHEKHEFYEDNISSLNAKSFNHNIRISNLEDKVLTA